MNKAITFFKQNIISTIIICISILGLLFEIIGAFAFCSSTDVGINMKVFTNAMVIIGIIFVSISFIASIEETIRYKIKKLDTTISILSFEISCTIILISLIFLIMFSAWDLIINL